MSEAKQIVLEVKEAMTAYLAELTLKALEESIKAMNNQVALSGDGRELHGEKSAVIKQFAANIAHNFDALVGNTQIRTSLPDYGSLSLIAEDDLEAIIAMEGMVAHSRNCDIQEYLSFTTRLESLLYGTPIDESNNPMDPEQIGDAFREAMRPMGLKSAALLTSYRFFNTHVFHELESALSRANEILIAHDILPKLDIAARSKKQQENRRKQPRDMVDPIERAFSMPPDKSQESPRSGTGMFSMMQNLMHGSGHGGDAQVSGPQGVTGPGVLPPGIAPAGTPPQPGAMPAPGQLPVIGYDLNGVAGGPYALQPGMMVGDQVVELVPPEQLTSILSKLQTTLDEIGESGAREALDLNARIAELLQQEAPEGTLSALDGMSSDVINLMTLLYEAIWQDETIQIPVKELIGRTQITMLRIALDDPDFFDNENHPARVLINELATAGISWTQFDKLEEDPVYRKMLDIVETLINEYNEDMQLVVSLVVSFKTFKRQQEQESKKTEERLKDVDARKERMHEINEYARNKISERILGEGIHPFVIKFLHQPFHRFLVQLIMTEGPNGVSWKPVMNTIDVLLWSVQREKEARDILRFDKLRPRLMQNLKKALEVAEVEEEKADIAITNLEKIQRKSFKDALRRELAASKQEQDREQEAAAAEAAEAVEAEEAVEAVEAVEKAAADGAAAGESAAPLELEAMDGGTTGVDTAGAGAAETEAAAAAADGAAGSEQGAELSLVPQDPEPGAEQQAATGESEAGDEAEAEQALEADGGEAPDLEEEIAPEAAAELIGEDDDDMDLAEELSFGDEQEFGSDMDILAVLEEAAKRDDLPEEDEHVQLVNKLPVGVWMEFELEGDATIRCTLAAKISTIDKYVFVNEKGVKVVEKSRMGLARELKDGTVKIISESPLVDRAMETVIGKLRESGSEH